jgi:cytochrome P450
LLGVVTGLLAIWYFYKPRNLPPGPRGFPILGYMPYMIRDPLRTFSKIGEKYGPIFSIYLGSRLVVMINDYEVIKQCLVQSTSYFKDRPKDIAFNVEGEDSFVFEYDTWRHHRRFALTTLRDFGVGKLSLEPKLLEEIEQFTKHLEKTEGKATDFRDLIGISAANNICSLTFGKRYDYNDEQFTKLKRVLDEMVEQFSTVTPRIFFPWLSYIPGVSKLLKTEQTLKTFKVMKSFINNIIADHRKSHYPDRKDDYIHAYITEQGNRSDGLFTDATLEEIGRGFFGAGTETTQTWLCWIILYLAMNPDMQRKVQKEMDEVVGKERCPNYSDRTRTPYLSAFIAEIGRYVTVVPIAPPHTQKQVATVGEYSIPPNTYIIYNIWNVHHDPRLWGDPQVFRPERFINENGEIQAPEYYMPFGVGKRSCMGESLARMEVYLYAATFVQKFTFSPPNGEAISTEGKFGLTFTPKTFRVCAVRRF